jgi:hypothetical protein
MPNHRWHLGLVPLVCILSLAACSALNGGYTIPTRHPEELDRGSPVCTECHEADDENIAFADFSHDGSWAQSHRQRTYGNEKVCAMCHGQSFCNDCHVTRSELKPSVRRQADTYRQLPHRGDYLSRHRIDARLDPTSCFRCHGNPKASKTCAPCHG